ncbi:BrnA antitoxin family protein [Methylobacterium gossipiicola]|uniref:BrnA antitoxin of type II toxin-antitoxin system n=1 Tax=Methylobacterium gossipiicola TaxID=582675 RepID=A0A1I2TB10_9HYPH|nr:BrnA antitoxin family protein [Methylobacterium gossipiicola]SFG60437.1 BrnA antitoxin of type II toxin-antitoxin system [Methylobacterium gossipiicola]
MAFERSRRPSDPRQAAEAAFKAATTKPAPASRPAAPAPQAAPAVPGAREMVSLRLDRAVLEHFQKDGPGWQDRVNAALKAAVGL